MELTEAIVTAVASLSSRESRRHIALRGFLTGQGPVKAHASPSAESDQITLPELAQHPAKKERVITKVRIGHKKDALQILCGLVFCYYADGACQVRFLTAQGCLLLFLIVWRLLRNHYRPQAELVWPVTLPLWSTESAVVK